VAGINRTKHWTLKELFGEAPSNKTGSGQHGSWASMGLGARKFGAPGTVLTVLCTQMVNFKSEEKHCSQTVRLISTG